MWQRRGFKPPSLSWDSTFTSPVAVGACLASFSSGHLLTCEQCGPHAQVGVRAGSPRPAA